MTGQKWNRLTAIRFVQWKYWASGKRDPVWLWKCDCGNEKEVLATNVKSGQVKSCGCFLSERMREVHTRHGAARHGSEKRMYRVFIGMRSRCSNPKDGNYKRYGARGIRVEWPCYEDFEKDMGPSYKKGLTIGRINNDGNYCKENCRWETYLQQERNKSSNVVVNYNGQSKAASEWAEELKMPYTTLLSRLYANWPIEKALTTPVRYKTPHA